MREPHIAERFGEVGGRDDPAIALAHADQRLDADDAAIGEIDDRLEVEDQPVPGARLTPSPRGFDVWGVGPRRGVGFPVSILPGELSCAGGPPHTAGAKPAMVWPPVLGWVPPASFRCAMMRRYAQLARQEQIDVDANDVPDVYEQPVRTKRGGDG